jgi:hypothetical protein
LPIVLLAAPGFGARRDKPASTRSIAPAPAGLSALSTQSVCSIGTSGPAVYVIDYLQPPDDAYYLHVQPASCPTCGGKPGVWISSVNVKLEFRVPCSQPVVVSVVSMLGDTTCAPPDPPRVMRGPVAATLTAVAPGTFDFSVPLEGPVALLGDRYLRVMFPSDGAGCTADGTRPRLVTTASCFDCFAWNYFPADTSDLCQLLFPGTPIIYALVDSCVSPSLAGVDGGPGSPSGVRITPNPARASADVRFTLGAPARVQLTVCDVAGRRVRGLLDAPLAAGEHAFAWDGRADDGTRVRPGTYFAVVRQDDRAVARRLVLLGAGR